MIFSETPLQGAFTIDLEKREDERGFFARSFCVKEFGANSLLSSIVQINNSLTLQKGTLRGMHYQVPAMAEVKVVRCIRGALFDVIIDLRPGSPTFGQSYGVELTAENRRMLYVPEQFAHGFLTLTDNTEAFYLVSQYYSAPHERGIRWDDPRFSISWPYTPLHMSDKDASWPDYSGGP